MDAVRAAWSDEHICRSVRDFLIECGWELELNDRLIRIPQDAELLVYSSAVVVSDFDGFGDHVEAIVYIGVKRSPPNLFPVHGVIRLYLNPSGKMITEDRYLPSAWFETRT